MTNFLDELECERGCGKAQAQDMTHVHRAPYNVHRTTCTVQRAPYNAHRTMHTVQCTPYNVQRTPYSDHPGSEHEQYMFSTGTILGQNMNHMCSVQGPS